MCVTFIHLHLSWMLPLEILGFTLFYFLWTFICSTEKPVPVTISIPRIVYDDVEQSFETPRTVMDTATRTIMVPKTVMDKKTRQIQVPRTVFEDREEEYQVAKTIMETQTRIIQVPKVIYEERQSKYYDITMTIMKISFMMKRTKMMIL